MLNNVRKIDGVVAARVSFLPRNIGSKIFFTKNFVTNKSEARDFCVINTYENYTVST